MLILEEFNEAPDLGLEDDRHQRLHQEVHCTEGIPFLHLRAVDVAGGEKDDGRVPGAVLGTEEPGRLEAADPRHQHVKQDDGELVRLQMLEGFLAGAGFHEVVAQVVEQRPQREQVGRVVIDQEDARLRLGRQFIRKTDGCCGIRHVA